MEIWCGGFLAHSFFIFKKFTSILAASASQADDLKCRKCLPEDVLTLLTIALYLQLFRFFFLPEWSIELPKLIGF